MPRPGPKWILGEFATKHLSEVGLRPGAAATVHQESAAAGRRP